ncbi:hypothetical protein JKA74_04425 [Marivirga sp. S37H4]|uniref:Outer membrane protein beta-barrel domain-containing protein n=1 Tax=Marivirga aurantiaca TaxID=2802615 RepID=A0A934WWK4_9BACT|nr:hypothetical protein [Marivirga aurantiaca]MBK6264272.1 hypothetical protein [Marivirga aurantiaca]
MHKPLSITVFVVSLLISMQIHAQDSDSLSSQNEYKFGIGAGAGFATGYGLSFRYIPEKFGGQVNFAPYKDKETERYSFGVTFLYMLIESNSTNLFLYQANHYYYNSEISYLYNPGMPNNQEETRYTEGYFNNGLGFGIEIIFVKRVGLNIMAGYAFYDNFQQLNVTGELALYYKF